MMLGCLTSIRFFVVERIKCWNLWYSRFMMGMASKRYQYSGLAPKWGSREVPGELEGSVRTRSYELYMGNSHTTRLKMPIKTIFRCVVVKK